MASMITAVTPVPSTRRLSFALSYAALVVVPVIALFAILRIGSWLPAGGHAASPPAAPAEGLLKMPLLLAQIVVILGVSRLLGALLRRMGQPAVIGEMIAGLLLGASFLGIVAPGAYHALFPRGTLRFLSALSQIGVLMFMFLVGLDLDRDALRRRGRAALLTSHAGIAIPMFLGAALAIYLFPIFGVAGERFTPFALFLGTAMSITAFPVLARILHERGLRHSEVGAVAVASAAVDDVSAWCIMALVVAGTRAGTDAFPLWATVGGLALHVGVMLGVVRPLFARFAAAQLDRHEGRLTPGLVAMAVIVALGSAWVTEVLGIHALFGAFLAGIVMPTDRRLVEGLRQRFEDVMGVLLLPLFFALTGIRTNITLLGGAAWEMCLAIIAVAIVGKFGGTSIAARVGGMPWRGSLVIGALMNTRGLMELIILNIGLDLGVLTPALFAMMVLMALITTLMTTPMVDLLTRRMRATA